MKKLFGTLLFTFFLSRGVVAQTFTIPPSNIDTVTAPFNQLSIFDIYENNISGDTLLLKWDFVSMNLPSGWDYSMCDFTTCYVGIPGGTMDAVMAGGQGFNGLNISPYAISGTGTVRIYVYDVNFPMQGDTLTWVIFTPDLLDVKESLVVNFSFFPNPSSSFINVTLADFRNDISMQILDISGRLIETKSILSKSSNHSIEHIPNGVYFIRITENNFYTTRPILIQH